jgi:hypothetical protein
MGVVREKLLLFTLYLNDFKYKNYGKAFVFLRMNIK